MEQPAINGAEQALDRLNRCHRTRCIPSTMYSWIKHKFPLRDLVRVETRDLALLRFARDANEIGDPCNIPRDSRSFSRFRAIPESCCRHGTKTRTAATRFFSSALQVNERNGAARLFRGSSLIVSARIGRKKIITTSAPPCPKVASLIRASSAL